MTLCRVFGCRNEAAGTVEVSGPNVVVDDDSGRTAVDLLVCAQCRARLAPEGVRPDADKNAT
jgi:hypothetical protein